MRWYIRWIKEEWPVIVFIIILVIVAALLIEMRAEQAVWECCQPCLPDYPPGQLDGM